MPFFLNFPLKDVIEKSWTKYTEEDSERFKTLVQLDCRGFEPVNVTPNGPWKCKSTESSTEFLSINFEDDEWNDYDENAKEVVAISEMTMNFIKIKK